MSPPAHKPHVLFVAEAVTLAHVARPMLLARGLHARGYKLTFAADARFAAICGPVDWSTEAIESIPVAQFVKALHDGDPLYSIDTTRAYVKADIALLERLQPDVIVSDFRLSLIVSARRLGIPFINITNASWSPYARPAWEIPDLPFWRRLPHWVGDLAFKLVRSFAFRQRVGSMNQLLREFGVDRQLDDLAAMYVDGDITLYADTPELIPVFGAPASHRYVGLLPWAPTVPLPDWWQSLDVDRQVIYVTLGSSGSGARLPSLIEALSRLGLPVIVAVAGAQASADWPSHVHAATYLPGDLAAQRSALVVCNGGASTAHQALVAGVPVLALPSNLDQFLNAGYLESVGAGEWLRERDATPDAVERLARRIIDEPRYKRAAMAMAESAARIEPIDVLERAIGDLLSPAARAAKVG